MSASIQPPGRDGSAHASMTSSNAVSIVTPRRRADRRIDRVTFSDEELTELALEAEPFAPGAGIEVGVRGAVRVDRRQRCCDRVGHAGREEVVGERPARGIRHRHVAAVQGGTFVELEMGMQAGRLTDRLMDVAIGRSYFRRWASG